MEGIKTFAQTVGGIAALLFVAAFNIGMFVLSAWLSWQAFAWIAPDLSSRIISSIVDNEKQAPTPQEAEKFQSSWQRWDESYTHLTGYWYGFKLINDYQQTTGYGIKLRSTDDRNTSLTYICGKDERGLMLNVFYASRKRPNGIIADEHTVVYMQMNGAAPEMVNAYIAGITDDKVIANIKWPASAEGVRNINVWFPGGAADSFDTTGHEVASIPFTQACRSL